MRHFSACHGTAANTAESERTSPSPSELVRRVLARLCFPAVEAAVVAVVLEVVLEVVVWEHWL